MGSQQTVPTAIYPGSRVPESSARVPLWHLTLTPFILDSDTIYLTHEYNIAAVAVGLNAKQIRQSQLDALDMAFLGSEEKAALLANRSE